MGKRGLLLAMIAVAALAIWSCGDDDDDGAGSTSVAPRQTLTIGGIPDQSPATLDRTFGLMAAYLGKATGMDVKYSAANDYAAIVQAFRRGDVQLVWFGGLTGVQAREFVPGSDAVVQRPRDAQFQSVFIAQANSPISGLADLKGRTFTFGSESSTSGHLMPRHFMTQAGVDPDKDLKSAPGYSGSHDKTYQLVESGAAEAGALNIAVWESAVRDKKVDTAKVKVFYTSPPYFDYNWTIRADIDKTHGAGAREKLTKALLDLRAEMGADEREVLGLFATDRFVATENKNYDSIRQVAERLKILRPQQ